MDIHDKSNQRGLAFILAIILFLGIYVYSKFDKPKEVQSQIIKAPTIEEAAASKGIETGYVNTMDSHGDIYNNRQLLLNEIKSFDKSIDFSGNYDQDSDETDNSISGEDQYGLNIQITGSKKHVKETDFYYVPNANYGFNMDPVSYILSGINILDGNKAKDWVAVKMVKIIKKPQHFLADSVVIEEKKLVMTYDGDTNTVDLTIKHK